MTGSSPRSPLEAPYRQLLPPLQLRRGNLHLGVIGHRNIPPAEESKIRGLIRDELAWLAVRYQLQEITLHTCMAKGADRWVQEELKTLTAPTQGAAPATPSRKALHCTIQAVFPYCEQAYRHQMDEADRAEFDACLSSASFAEKSKVINLNPSLPPESLTGNAPDCRTRREDCLAAVAPYFEDHCQLVLVLSSGIRSHRAGGTMDLIDRILRPKAKPPKHLKALLTLTTPQEGIPFTALEPYTWQTDFPAHRPRPGRLHQFTKRYGRIAAIVTLVCLTLSLGIIGHIIEHNPSRPHAAATQPVEIHPDTVLVTVGYLFNSFDWRTEPGLASNHYITASRYCGLASFLLTVAVLLEMITHFFRRIGLLRAGFKKHDLILGLGWRGQSLLTNGGQHARAIAMDTRPTPSLEELCVEVKAAWIKADASAAASLDLIRLHNTQRAFICTGNDETNLAILHNLAQATLRQGRSPNTKSGRKITCAVSLEKAEHFQILHDSLPADHCLDLRPFHTETVTARAFLRTHHIDRFTLSPGAKGARVVIIGDSPMASTLTRTLIQQGCYESGKALEIFRLVSDPASATYFVEKHPCYIAPPTIQLAAASLVTLHPKDPWLTENVLPVLHFALLPSNDAELIQWVTRHLNQTDWVLTVIVAHEQGTESAACARTLLPVLGPMVAAPFACDVALWFLYNTPDESIRFELERNIDRLHPALPVRALSDFLGVCTRDLATGEVADQIARRLNAYYCDKTVSLADQPTVNRLWETAREADRESTREAAEHAIVKLRIRQRLREKGRDEPDIMIQLSSIEHRRWCAYHLMLGFRSLTPIPSLTSSFNHTAEIKHQIESWFGDKIERTNGTDRSSQTSHKTLLKGQFWHIDLVPYHDMPTLFKDYVMRSPSVPNDQKISLAANEMKKDDVSILDVLVNGMHRPEQTTS